MSECSFVYQMKDKSFGRFPNCFARKTNEKEIKEMKNSHEQGRIHGNPVADGWAGALMRKPLAIQKCDGRTDRLTDGPIRQGVESCVCD